jgi:hypothetical protein
MREIRESLGKSCVCLLKTGFKLASFRKFVSIVRRSAPQESWLISRQHQSAPVIFSAIAASSISLAIYKKLSPDETPINLELLQITIKKDLTFAMMQLRKFLNPVLQEQQ